MEFSCVVAMPGDRSSSVTVCAIAVMKYSRGACEAILGEAQSF